MDVHKILEKLREERVKIERAIAVIEDVARGDTGKRRGRPPKWLKRAGEEGDKES